MTEKEPKLTSPVAMKQAPRETVEVSLPIMMLTDTFDATKPVLVDDAEKLFIAQIKEIHGPGELSNMRLIRFRHHTGKSVEYEFVADFSSQA